MVRTSQATTISFSPYFDDRGPYQPAQPITERVHPHSRPIVSYFFPKGAGDYHYGEHHPMKPHRLALTNALILGYGLDKQIHHIYNPMPATKEELEMYHEKEYVEFLERIKPTDAPSPLLQTFNCVEDCPIFPSLYTFCCQYSGASLAAARKLCAGACDVAINWSGGLHHAKRGEASGFCYVNDIVLAILEMLKYYPRVLYIDIDIHHGDGVELAFYHTPRVFTLSLHKYTGLFFPGTGKLTSTGAGAGKHFALNIPLNDGIDDAMYLTVFKTVVEEVVGVYRPSAIVIQCGADSLGCDRLGAFNLSIAGHGECVNFVRRFNVPLLVLGGGGYTIKNVSRCWTYETSVLVGAEIPDSLPHTVYDPFFADSSWRLHPPLTGRVENMNDPKELQRMMVTVRGMLRYLQGAPSVAMQEIPPGLEELLREKEEKEREGEERDEEEEEAEEGGRRERTYVPRNELYDGEGDVDREDGVGVVAPKAKVATRKPRGGARRSRARGRAKTTNPGSARDREYDLNDEGPGIADTSTARSARGKGRGRGRGKTRASASVRAGAGEKNKERAESAPGRSMSAVGEADAGVDGDGDMAGLDLDVDI